MFSEVARRAKQVDVQPLPDVMVFPAGIALEFPDKNIYEHDNYFYPDFGRYAGCTGPTGCHPPRGVKSIRQAKAARPSFRDNADPQTTSRLHLHP
jgi:hypothetical protein